MLREDIEEDDSKVPKFKPASISDVESEVTANKAAHSEASSPTSMDSPKMDEDIVVSSAEASKYLA
jgi:hypothetical protein